MGLLSVGQTSNGSTKMGQLTGHRGTAWVHACIRVAQQSKSQSGPNWLWVWNLYRAELTLVNSAHEILGAELTSVWAELTRAELTISLLYCLSTRLCSTNVYKQRFYYNLIRYSYVFSLDRFEIPDIAWNMLIFKALRLVIFTDVDMVWSLLLVLPWA